MTNDEREKRMMKVLQIECAKYGYKCEKKFGIVYITSKYEGWSFKPYIEGNHVKLMHRNNKGEKMEWHKQFTKKLTYKQLVQYIYEHEHSKFYPGYTHVTVVKDCNKAKDFHLTKKRRRSFMLRSKHIKDK